MEVKTEETINADDVILFAKSQKKDD